MFIAGTPSGFSFIYGILWRQLRAFGKNKLINPAPIFVLSEIWRTREHAGESPVVTVKRGLQAVAAAMDGWGNAL
jgi:hypothetical protein